MPYSRCFCLIVHFVVGMQQIFGLGLFDCIGMSHQRGTVPAILCNFGIRNAFQLIAVIRRQYFVKANIQEGLQGLPDLLQSVFIAAVKQIGRIFDCLIDVIARSKNGQQRIRNLFHNAFIKCKTFV